MLPGLLAPSPSTSRRRRNSSPELDTSGIQRMFSSGRARAPTRFDALFFVLLAVVLRAAIRLSISRHPRRAHSIRMDGDHGLDPDDLAVPDLEDVDGLAGAGR